MNTPINPKALLLTSPVIGSRELDRLTAFLSLEMVGIVLTSAVFIGGALFCIVEAASLNVSEKDVVSCAQAVAVLKNRKRRLQIGKIKIRCVFFLIRITFPPLSSSEHQIKDCT